MINVRELSNQELHALSRMRLDNAAVLKLVASQVEATKQKLVREGDMVIIHRLQGRAEAYEDLLRAVEESAEALNRA